MRAQRATRATATALLGILTLTGCDIGSRIVGIHPPATEVVGGAPLGEATAQAIAVRALTDAQTAAGTAGAAGTTARKAALTGSALLMAEAAISGKAAVPAPDQLATQNTPKVLALTKGQAWPRTMLVTTADKDTGIQRLHVLVSANPTAPYVVSADIPMLSGAVIPALGPVPDGTTLATDGTGLAAAPKDVLTAYAAALAYPKPTATKLVGLKDAMSTGLAAGAAAQAKALGSLATLTQAQAVVPEHTIAIRLVGGGALVFGVLKRTDTVTLAKTAKELVLPPPVAALVGKPKVTTSVTTTTYAAVALVVPATGPATVVAADEQLAAAKGT